VIGTIELAGTLDQTKPERPIVLTFSRSWDTLLFLSLDIRNPGSADSRIYSHNLKVFRLGMSHVVYTPGFADNLLGTL
jgi:hypothetical protein